MIGKANKNGLLLLIPANNFHYVSKLR